MKYESCQRAIFAPIVVKTPQWARKSYHGTSPFGGRQELRFHEIDFVVNRAPGKLYIQSAWRLPTAEKREQELLPLRRSGDFFAKIIVTEGLQPPMKDDEGIVHVGIIPFLLDESILETALKTSVRIASEMEQ